MKPRLFAVALLLSSCSRAPEPVLRVELVSAIGTVSDPGLRTARDVLAKRIESFSKGSRVREENGALVVDLDASGAAGWAELKDTLLRVGNLDFVAIADAAPFADDLAKAARAAGLRADEERSFSGSSSTWTFEADDRAVLATTLAELLAKASNDDRYQVALLAEEKGKPARAQILDRLNHHLHASVIEARPDEDPQGVSVSATLSPESARLFEGLTRRLIGHKLAVVLDGEIQVAPVVVDAIAGGNIQITLGSGGRNRDALRREANALSRVLASGQLPFPLVVRSVSAIRP